MAEKGGAWLSLMSCCGKKAALLHDHDAVKWSEYRICFLRLEANHTAA